ncbi:Putative protein [Zobellia galactanivorans]|uniref:Uncharacterized protein n=1 Tax=Zobellia galactanivorans (strain DSM 12802 / CCUG 47099 / CIP 106680 / NCIMB 13871 / Dsij) TaxID=63186 RepID=G0L0C3_ZOBGA|nr:Putative protein [Zobellia galactanivorans]
MYFIKGWHYLNLKLFFVERMLGEALLLMGGGTEFEAGHIDNNRNLFNLP